MLKDYKITDDILEHMSPYIRDHINRFGKYDLDKNRKPPTLKFDLLFE
jgi:hypothetical protein